MLIQDAQRAKCYTCYRPLKSCLCSCVHPIKTRTKFVILMHPKEFKKTKNNTGRLTHLSLKNSELIIDEAFAQHKRVNELINDPANNCHVLYPSNESVNLNANTIVQPHKQSVVFIIDATWPCSKKMLRLSPNLLALPKVSFTHTKTSQYQIKTQPAEHCLSTIESTLCVLELLNAHGSEQIAPEQFERFLSPFYAMIEHQLACVEGEGRMLRYKAPNPKHS